VFKIKTVAKEVILLKRISTLIPNQNVMKKLKNLVYLNFSTTALKMDLRLGSWDINEVICQGHAVYTISQHADSTLKLFKI